MQKNAFDRRAFLSVVSQATACTAIGCCLCEEACAAEAASHIAERDISLDAICGIYCGACPALLASRAAKSPAEAKCLGCRSKKKSPSYASKCDVRACAKAKNVDSCGLCKHYPCKKIAAFFNETPKYGLREKYLNAVRDKGLSAWRDEMKTRWTCKKCGAAFGYGMTTCKSCGEKVWSDAEEFAEFKAHKNASKKTTSIS